jgi:hypothetical protein
LSLLALSAAWRLKNSGSNLLLLPGVCKSAVQESWVSSQLSVKDGESCAPHAFKSPVLSLSSGLALS